MAEAGQGLTRFTKGDMTCLTCTSILVLRERNFFCFLFQNGRRGSVYVFPHFVSRESAFGQAHCSVCSFRCKYLRPFQ